MKLFIDIATKRIYLFNTVAWNFRKKIGFPVCKQENFAGIPPHRKRGKSARAIPTPHHTLNEEGSTRFTAWKRFVLRVNNRHFAVNQGLELTRFQKLSAKLGTKSLVSRRTG